jgi:polyphosphate kinase 2 (PPK2 family)
LRCSTTSYGGRPRDLSERGRIGIFNRSYDEEVRIVRVHRELLLAEGLSDKPHDDKDLWHDRYRLITNLERALHANGTHRQILSPPVQG